MHIYPQITEKVANNLEIDLAIVDKVIAHQWKTAHEHVSKVSSIEISGLGEFRIHKKGYIKDYEKAEHLLEYYEKCLNGEIEHDYLTNTIITRIEKCKEILTYLKTKKIHETK